jgi:hypothetical protein
VLVAAGAADGVGEVVSARRTRSEIRNMAHQTIAMRRALHQECAR